MGRERGPEVTSTSDLLRLVGTDLGWSGPFILTQDEVSLFARLTRDEQWIHVEPGRARVEGPYSGTVAHGFLVLDHAPWVLRQLLDLGAVRFGVNYGLNRTRFPSPVLTGTALRGTARIGSVDEIQPGVSRVTVGYEFCSRESTKPHCVAEMIHQFSF